MPVVGVGGCGHALGGLELVLAGEGLEVFDLGLWGDELGVFEGVRVFGEEGEEEEERGGGGKGDLGGFGRNWD